MSDIYVTLTAYSGGPEPGARSLQLLAGAPSALTLDTWAKGATAFVVSLPPGVVAVDPALVDAARKARLTREAAADAIEGTGRATSSELSEALDVEDDANAALADSILAQLGGDR